MVKDIRSHSLFILVLLGMSIFYFWGVFKVPFHPDESTHIFMSADFERMLTNPTGMIWKMGDLVPDIVRYRMIDAPITRYLLGFGRN
jgi:hypothetical protein